MTSDNSDREDVVRITVVSARVSTVVTILRKMFSLVDRGEIKKAELPVVRKSQNSIDMVAVIAATGVWINAFMDYLRFMKDSHSLNEEGINTRWNTLRSATSTDTVDLVEKIIASKNSDRLTEITIEKSEGESIMRVKFDAMKEDYLRLRDLASTIDDPQLNSYLPEEFVLAPKIAYKRDKRPLAPVSKLLRVANALSRDNITRTQEFLKECGATSIRALREDEVDELLRRIEN